MPSAGAGVFARDATGLVREVSAFRAAIFGSASAPIGLFVIYALPFLAAFAGTQPWPVYAAIAIALVGSVPNLINYSALSAAMPRSGGDYVFGTRLVRPDVGFATNVSLAISQIIGLGAFAALSVTTIISPLLSILGEFAGSTGITQAGTNVTSTGWVIALGGLLLLTVAIPLIRGTDFALKINVVLWLAGMAAIVIMIIGVFATSRAGFIGKFDAHVGKTGAYAGVIADARSSGMQRMGNFASIWPLVAVMVPSVGWWFWSTYIGGEVRRAGAFKRQLDMMFYPLVLSAVALFLLVAAVMKTFGYTFVTSVFWLAVNDPAKLPSDVASGGPIFLAGLAMGGGWIAALFVITFLAWIWPALLIGVLMPIRAALAWSMDLVFPEAIARVSPRWHTPVRLTILVSFIMFAVAIYSTGTDAVLKIYAVSIVQAALCSWAITGVAAIMFRRKMPELYAQQPISQYGPLLKICGALSILYTLFWCAAYFKYPDQFGMTTWVAVFFVALWVVSFGIFHAVRAYRESQGIPLSSAFQTLPPE